MNQLELESIDLKGIPYGEMYKFYRLWMTEEDAEKATQKYIDMQNKYYGESDERNTKS